MSTDLRSFIDFLEKEHPEELQTVSMSVSLEYEMTALAFELERHGRYPALLFDQVQGFDTPVIANLFASRRRIGMALGLEEKELVSGWPEKSAKRIHPKLSTAAPVKEIIHTGSEVDLQKLPIPVHFEVDAGRYITGGVVVACDPDTGIGNLNFTRFQLQGPGKLGASLHSRGDLWDFQRRQEAKNEPLEIAIIIGVHPCISIAAATQLPIDEDEMELAGGLMGKAVPVVPAETVNLHVPAEAEIVIEGFIEPGTRNDEGPLGEYTGYASSRSTRHIFQVTAVTHRKEPIFQDIVPGASAEHLNLSKVSRVPRVFEAAKRAFPNIVAMNYPMSGTHYHCYLSMQKLLEGQPKQAMLLLFGLDMYLKLVVVVDEDIDVHDEKQVLWAIATRFQADRDAVIVPGVLCNMLDPSAEDGIGAKMGLDATQALKSKAKSLKFSPEVLNNVKDGVQKILRDAG